MSKIPFPFSVCEKCCNKGLSAYEIAVNNGFEGTEQEWLESLEGEDGYTPEKGVDYYTDADKKELLAESALIANGAYAEAYIKTASYTKTTTDDITDFEINGDISPTPHIIKVNIRVAGDVTVFVYGDGKQLHREAISGTAGDYNFEFNSNGAYGYIHFDFIGASVKDYVIVLNVTYKQDTSVVRAENQGAIANLIVGQNELEQSVGDIETALDSILAMQNELIGGDSV